MNRRSSLRALDGILLLDKQPGMSSNAALQKAKRLFGARKAGHTGSLDPIASGLLIVCFGEATKLSGFLLNTDKRYRVRIRLGVTTETGDAEGRVIETRSVPALSAGTIEPALSGYRGAILQVPPMYSALKHRGRRLYELARQGLEVTREPRAVTIHELTLLSVQDADLELDVHCSKGTYIRTLAEDIGRTLGCGGHVTHLRRTAIGDFSVAAAMTLDQLTALDDTARLQRVLPMDRAVASFPSVQFNEELSFYLRRGEPVQVPRSPTQGWVRLYTKPMVFLGIGEVLDDGRIAPRRLIRRAAGDLRQRDQPAPGGNSL